jgi:isopentenyl phosphate kinase
VIEKISIINGTVPGMITKALNGEIVGTTIYRE